MDHNIHHLYSSSGEYYTVKSETTSEIPIGKNCIKNPNRKNLQEGILKNISESARML